MLRYVVYRLLWLVPTLLAMALVTFLVMHATPGSPLDPVAEGANPLSPEAQKNLAEAYGLDKPLCEQFGIFLSARRVRGDFGNSFVYKTRTVTRDHGRDASRSRCCSAAWPWSLAVAGGLTLGVLAAVYQNRSWDYVSVSVATLGVSVPNFVLAVFLIVLFSFVLPHLPDRRLGLAAGLGAADGDARAGPDGHHRALHALEHARGHPLRLHRDRARQGAGRARRSSSSTCSRTRFIPVVTLLGPMFAAVGTGSFFVESIFRVPGMGRFFVLSMTGRDYPMIMAVVLIYGAFLALMNLVVDLALWLSRPPHPVLASPTPGGAGAGPALDRADPGRRASGATPGDACSATSWRWRAGWWSSLLCLLAIFADVLAPQSYTKPNFGRLYESPSRDYPLGTDQLGRDVLSRHDLRRPRVDAGGARAPRSSSC